MPKAFMEKTLVSYVDDNYEVWKDWGLGYSTLA
jgi:hypothetical protein